jgi:hypothetical protein
MDSPDITASTLRRCTATRTDGRPCNGRPMRGRDVCAAHAGLTGAPRGNKNRLTHGLYAGPERRPLDQIAFEEQYGKGWKP